MKSLDIRAKIRAAGGDVLDVRETGSGHHRYRIKGPKGIFIVFKSKSPSCSHAERNFISDVKRGIRNGKV